VIAGEIKMKKTRKTWLIARIFLILLGVFQGYSFTANMSGDFSNPSWLFLVEMVVIVAFRIVFVISIQANNCNALAKWQCPSWYVNPFNYREPLQFFDAASYYFLATGFTALILAFTESPFLWAWALPLSIGVGIMIGVRLSLLIFKNRLNPT
jgi:hypothetical protein